MLQRLALLQFRAHPVGGFAAFGFELTSRIVNLEVRDKLKGVLLADRRIKIADVHEMNGKIVVLSACFFEDRPYPAATGSPIGVKVKDVRFPRDQMIAQFNGLAGAVQAAM
ncbi:MAG: hypothetical protein U0X75_15865 [Acidobacteriota bacterium]